VIFYQSATTFPTEINTATNESPATCTFVPFYTVSTVCVLGHIQQHLLPAHSLGKAGNKRFQVRDSTVTAAAPLQQLLRVLTRLTQPSCTRHSRTKLESREALLPEHPPRAVADPDAAAQKQTWDTG